MDFHITGEEALILLFICICLYGLGWLFTNVIIPRIILSRAAKRRKNRSKK